MKPEVNPNRECKAVQHDFKYGEDEDVPDYGEPGLAQRLSTSNHLHFNCPGCRKFGGISVQHPKVPHSWDLVSGNLDDVTSLTLAPSIHCIGCFGWHGYLIKGNFQLDPNPRG